MKEHKWKIIAFSIILLVIALLLSPRNAISLENAIVNEENGDIVFTYFNSSSYTLTIFWYNADGELLLKDNIKGGSSSLKFVGEDLKVYIEKYDIIGFYGKDGSKSVVTVAVQEEYSPKWAGWSSSYGYKECIFDKFTYQYEETPYPNNLIYSKFSMKIKNNETGEVTELISKEVKFPFK